MNPIRDRLTFARWNTGLSPAGKERSGKKAVSEEDFRVAAAIVNGLFQTHEVHCLALGEVTRKDLDRLCDKLDPAEYSLYDGTFKDNRLVFDIGVIFSKDRMSLDSHLEIIDRWGSQRLKLANQLKFTVAS